MHTNSQSGSRRTIHSGAFPALHQRNAHNEIGPLNRAFSAYSSSGQNPGAMPQASNENAPVALNTYRVWARREKSQAFVLVLVLMLMLMILLLLLLLLLLLIPGFRLD